MRTEREMDLKDGWTVGPSSTGDGGSHGHPSLACSLLKYLGAGRSDNSSTVRGHLSYLMSAIQVFK